MPINSLLNTTIDSRVNPGTFYMHSQQPLMGPPPPGYMPYFPSQAVPPMFQSYPQGVGVGITGSRFPQTAEVTSVGQERSDTLNSNRKPLVDKENDNGEGFTETWNSANEDSGKNALGKNVIWHDEDPLPESSWTHVLGKKDSQSISPLHSLSPSMLDSKEIDGIVHQSQVDDDSFQPYAIIKPPSIIPALAERTPARKLESSTMDNSVMTLAQAREPFSLHGKQNLSNGNFLASAMTASEDVMDFCFGDTLQVVDDPQEDVLYYSGSGSPEDMGPPPLAPSHKNHSTNQFLFRCQLCYQRFQTSDELKSHGSSDLSHLELCLLDSGCEKVWHYSPPPPQRSQQMKVCSMYVVLVCFSLCLFFTNISSDFNFFNFLLLFICMCV